MIKVNGKLVTDIRYGDIRMARVYFGKQLVWHLTPVPYLYVRPETLWLSRDASENEVSVRSNTQWKASSLCLLPEGEPATVFDVSPQRAMLSPHAGGAETVYVSCNAEWHVRQ